MNYVPSWKHNLTNFKQRMMRYAQLAGAPIPKYDGILGMPHVFPAAKTPQEGSATPLRCCISPTLPSLQSVGFSDASINTRLDVIEEGLDDPNYYVNQ